MPNHVERRFRFKKWLRIVKDSASKTAPIFGFRQLFWATLDERPGEWDPKSNMGKVLRE